MTGLGHFFCVFCCFRHRYRQTFGVFPVLIWLEAPQGSTRSSWCTYFCMFCKWGNANRDYNSEALQRFKFMFLWIEQTSVVLSNGGAKVKVVYNV